MNSIAIYQICRGQGKLTTTCVLTAIESSAYFSRYPNGYDLKCLFVFFSRVWGSPTLYVTFLKNVCLVRTSYTYLHIILYTPLSVKCVRAFWTILCVLGVAADIIYIPRYSLIDWSCDLFSTTFYYNMYVNITVSNVKSTIRNVRI